nr:MAG TPA: hypothetical protein [Caudoviricetes sp.]
MSDFGAGTCDFHSDFRTEWNDYAGDFGGAPRTAKQPPEATAPVTTAEASAGHRQGHRGTRTAASWQRKRQATEQRTTPRHKAINNGNRTSGAVAV